MSKLEKKDREIRLKEWAKQALELLETPVPDDFEISPVSDDASFRRYFRGQVGQIVLIFVDAPPDKENNRAFINVATLLEENGLQVPQVFAVDFEQGFMILGDFGDKLYLDQLKTDVAANAFSRSNELYQQAFTALKKMRKVKCDGLPHYGDRLLREEMNLFPDWFLTQQLQFDVGQEDRQELQRVFNLLVDNALQQPQGFVHRDFHSRNLMILGPQNPGIIDFQDAVQGPVTYDLVSLLKDCYWRFPREQVVNWVRDYWQMLDLDVGFDEFLRWFDLMGLQRHLKCAGIFSRLHLRDGKPGYLKDIPLVLDYMLEVTQIYDDLGQFGQWLEMRIYPLLTEKLHPGFQP